MKRSLKQKKQSKSSKNSDDITEPHAKLLLERFPYSIKDLQFREVPTMQVNQDFFLDPFKTIEHLYAKGYEKFGIVKLLLPPELIVPEKKFFSDLELKLKGKRVETRVQTLNSLQAGEIFGSNTVGFTLQEYMSYANKFECSHKLQGVREVSNQIRQNEIEFWSIVDFPERYDEVEVEYAADLLATKYATGFQDGQLGNLSSINKNSNSIFQVLQEKSEMSGISVPWLYLGMKYANFCWHKEDLNLNSLNYMHAGAPKTWYAIPPSHSEKFLQYFNKKYEKERIHNPRLLYDIVCQISPIELAEQQITVIRTEQHPGELIITLGATYHAGFSHGFNCSEAVNIAPSQWLDEYDRASAEYRMDGNLKKVIFDLNCLRLVFPWNGYQPRLPLWQIKSSLLNNHGSRYVYLCLLFQLYDKFKMMIRTEIDSRNSILALYEQVKTVEFANKLEKYDRNVCKICSNYMFSSYIFCGKCLKKGCIAHQSVCACSNPKISLYIRYNSEELQTMLTTLESKANSKTGL
ncbi:unnamed protein product (macronuclear) [Paramecium tetraurelia]|uniref:JmjC domain-containing protein n=1 Tax=Paramecium tetraurelia TaxID=5888 RepID=A0E742_PARTE|nr:uncharacterized protein GSPATT00023837001 [Paramecium tetraurelia]CAK91109.1 unnamed protein product [Paramecium tetraurelia]|eukprot:XP_001458506.1 hypothetical protein (macronuclear) [Paramecium tetraurelia strain d4-2]